MSIMTSLYPSVHGAFLDPDEEAIYSLSDKYLTLAEVWKSAGFSTAAYTGGGQVAREFGFNRGFDIYSETLGWITDENLIRPFNWILHHKNERFFVFLHTYQIHDPYTPPAPYRNLFGVPYDGPIIDDIQHLIRESNGKDYTSLAKTYWGGEKNFDKQGRLKYNLFSKKDSDRYLDLYDCEIAYADNQIHKILNYFRKLGIFKDTLFIITSDHGEEFGEHGEFLHEDLFAEDVFVPLILLWERGLPDKRVVDNEVMLIDLNPTILALLGINCPSQAQGRNLKPILHRQTMERIPVFSESPSGERFSLRFDRWSYIEEPQWQGLFDRYSDPWEQLNLIGEKAEIEQILRAAAHEISRNNLSAAADQEEIDLRKTMPSSKTLEILKSLGYIR